MSRRRIAAYTKEDIAPSYISINEESDGFASITVRSDRQADGSTGNLAVIRMTRDQLLNLTYQIQHNIGFPEDYYI